MVNPEQLDKKSKVVKYNRSRDKTLVTETKTNFK